ncbi:MAG TPA: B-box zinc finger protein [Sandaracinaceae bacterium LLY-WYZ-13_1]|nr:B-box zinc finger protein [Sandaracinaceae bacterium LLY-WYZ-13_1]
MTEPILAAGERDEAEARCAQHPDRPAFGGTCERCGSFLCQECRVPGREPPICEPCLDRLQGGRFVSQVPLFGIALMVHGALVLGLGLFAVVYSLFLVDAFAGLDPAATSGDPGMRLLPDLLVGSMLGIGSLNTFAGALQLWAGFGLRKYRGRWLGILSLAFGLVTVLSCYCAPTALGMLVWGLVILLGGDVAERFEAERRATA